MNALLSLLDIDTLVVGGSPFYCFWLLHWNLCHTNSIISAFVHPLFLSLSPLLCSYSFLPSSMERRSESGVKAAVCPDILPSMIDRFCGLQFIFHSFNEFF